MCLELAGRTDRGPSLVTVAHDGCLRLASEPGRCRLRQSSPGCFSGRQRGPLRLRRGVRAGALGRARRRHRDPRPGTSDAPRPMYASGPHIPAASPAHAQRRTGSSVRRAHAPGPGRCCPLAEAGENTGAAISASGPPPAPPAWTREDRRGWRACRPGGRET